MELHRLNDESSRSDDAQWQFCVVVGSAVIEVTYGCKISATSKIAQGLEAEEKDRLSLPQSIRGKKVGHLLEVLGTHTHTYDATGIHDVVC